MHPILSVLRNTRVRTGVVAGLLSVVLLATGCGPGDVGASKLKAVPKAAHRADVLTAMGTGPLTPDKPEDAARLVNGFRRQLFISDSKAWEVLWYRDEPGALSDSIVKARETPVVIESDTIVGWGWKFYDSFATAHNLPNPPKDKARMDSIVKSQLPPDKK